MGGGTFIEHELMQNLAKELQKVQNLQIVYGCDRIFSPTEYLQHLK
jgi:hypothetical protein